MVDNGAKNQGSTGIKLRVFAQVGDMKNHVLPIGNGRDTYLLGFLPCDYFAPWTFLIV